jgi:hypothetical protein
MLLNLRPALVLCVLVSAGCSTAAVPGADNQATGEQALEQKTCVPMTCAETGVQCGPVRDGCGHVLNCGNCSGADGGSPCCVITSAGGVCEGEPEVWLTCARDKAECGWAASGCGTQYCGNCKGHETCGGGGVQFQCGSGYYDACVPKTCFDEARFCGTGDDGCGGTLDCGTCTSPQVCKHGRCQ